MADNKKVVKKPSKSVLDYDPLGWLSEEAEDGENISEEKKVEVKNPVTAKVKTPIIEVENMDNSTEDSQGYGFFDSEQGEEPKSGAPNQMENIQSESEQGFGFFDDEPGEKVTELDEDEGYGFFGSSEPLSSQAVEIDREANVINLGAELTIRSVSACKALIDENITNGFDVKLAAGELQKIDTAGLQLIYSLNKALEKTSQSINWVSSNSIINDAAKLLGMPDLLESPDDESEGAFGFF